MSTISAKLSDEVKQAIDIFYALEKELPSLQPETMEAFAKSCDKTRVDRLFLAADTLEKPLIQTRELSLQCGVQPEAVVPQHNECKQCLDQCRLTIASSSACKILTSKSAQKLMIEAKDRAHFGFAPIHMLFCILFV